MPCLNNPLSLTDPSGYTWLSDNWRSLLAGAVGVSVAILTAGTGTAGSIALGQAIVYFLHNLCGEISHK
ncbi:MAG TPA: hypothetical protein VFD91_16115 [Mariniphaga sp.]|nr:hypothetical protein [Mariniphaga sp.]